MRFFILMVTSVKMITDVTHMIEPQLPDVLLENIAPERRKKSALRRPL
jgi:hypothetical protein